MKRKSERVPAPQLSVGLRLRDAIVDMQRDMDAIAENGRRRRDVRRDHNQRGNER